MVKGYHNIMEITYAPIHSPVTLHIFLAFCSVHCSVTFLCYAQPTSNVVPFVFLRHTIRSWIQPASNDGNNITTTHILSIIQIFGKTHTPKASGMFSAVEHTPFI